MLNRHITPFLQRFADVIRIAEGDIQDDLIHRQSKGRVLPQTINRESTVLRQGPNPAISLIAEFAEACSCRRIKQELDLRAISW